jgi:uncharacterized protein DUF732
MHRYKKSMICKADANACGLPVAVSHSTMIVGFAGRLLTAVAAALLATPTAHADGPDDQFLGLLSRDGVTVNNPQQLIGIAHQRCSDNMLGHDRGWMPQLGIVQSPYATAMNALGSRLARLGLTAPQVDHFMQDAVTVYCPDAQGS